MHSGQAGGAGGPAGNLFINGSGWVVNNNPGTLSAYTIDYYHDGSSNAVPQAVGVNLVQVSGSTACASRYGIQREPADYRLDFVKAGEIFEGERADLQARIDDGDTPHLLADIDNTVSSNDTVLVNRLLALSPYASYAALHRSGVTGKLSGTPYLTVL